MSRIEKKDFESQEILAEKFFICRRQKKKYVLVPIFS